MSGLFRLGLLFWVLVIFAGAFARYIVLALQDDDRPLAIAAAVACILLCAAALMEALGMLL
jgi:hypothetical protein